MGRSKRNVAEKEIEYRVLLRPESFSDLEQSIEFYSTRRKNLEIDFMKQIEITLDKIKANPFSYPKVRKTLRRAAVKDFPFGIFYLIKKSDIIVIAVLHFSRNIKNIRKRI